MAPPPSAEFTAKSPPRFRCDRNRFPRRLFPTPERNRFNRKLTPLLPPGRWPFARRVLKIIRSSGSAQTTPPAPHVSHLYTFQAHGQQVALRVDAPALLPLAGRLHSCARISTASCSPSSTAELVWESDAEGSFRLGLFGQPWESGLDAETVFLQSENLLTQIFSERHADALQLHAGAVVSPGRTRLAHRGALRFRQNLPHPRVDPRRMAVALGRTNPGGTATAPAWFRWWFPVISTSRNRPSRIFSFSKTRGISPVIRLEFLSPQTAMPRPLH